MPTHSEAKTWIVNINVVIMILISAIKTKSIHTSLMGTPEQRGPIVSMELREMG